MWANVIMLQLTVWRSKPVIYLLLVMSALSHCPATSPESAPPPFYQHGAVGTQRGPTASTSPTTSPCAAANTPTDAEASCCGDTMLFQHVCGLGYRPPWQVAGVEGKPIFTECRLCRSPMSNTIEHYCLACPAARGLLPQGQPLDAVCRHLLNHDFLESVIVRHPRFGGFS